MRSRAAVLGAAAALAMAVSGTAATSSAQASGEPHRGPLSALRKATARFHSIAAAEQRGYALLTDAQGIACIDMPGVGGMGVHWADGQLVADPAIRAGRPEAMVYAPRPDGTLGLAAVEYVVLQSDWDATHARRPRLFGHSFDLTEAPNRFGLPAFYSLHVWAWKHNPAGTFEMFNPRVRCPVQDTRHESTR